MTLRLGGRALISMRSAVVHTMIQMTDDAYVIVCACLRVRGRLCEHARHTHEISLLGCLCLSRMHARVCTCVHAHARTSMHACTYRSEDAHTYVHTPYTRTMRTCTYAWPVVRCEEFPPGRVQAAATEHCEDAVKEAFSNMFKLFESLVHVLLSCPPGRPAVRPAARPPARRSHAHLHA